MDQQFSYWHNVRNNGSSIYRLLFPLLLHGTLIRDTIARGVSNSVLAHIW